MSFAIIPILLIIIYILICQNNENIVPTEYFSVSRIDGRKYKTLDHFQNENDAADLLAKINKINGRIISYLLIKYKPGSKGYSIAKRLQEKYQPDRLIEHWPRNSSETAFTEDKGELFALCIRDKQKNKNLLHDLNTVVFVSLHELSHIASISYDHGNEFWVNFKFILLNAVESGLYIPIDYSVMPINYCSLSVNYSPLFDNEILVNFY